MKNTRELLLDDLRFNITCLPDTGKLANLDALDLKVILERIEQILSTLKD